MTKLQSRLDNIVHENGINNGNIQLLHLKQSTQQENIIDDLKKKINEQTSLIKISNDLNADLKNKMVLLDREYIEKLRIEQEKEWSEKSKLEIKKSELERRVSTLDLQIQEMQNRDEAYKKEVSIQHAKLDKQISTLVANNEELNSRIQMISSEREKIAAQNELNASKNGDFENRNAALIRDLDQKTRTEQTLKEKIASNDATIATLKSQLLEQSGTFQKEIASFNHNLEKQASTYSNEKLVLLNSLEELKFENDRLARDSLESSANFTKQMELFKSKLGAVKGKAKNYKSEVDSLKNALSIETSKAEDRIKSVCLSLT